MASFGSATVKVGVKIVFLPADAWDELRRMCVRDIEQSGDDPRVRCIPERVKLLMEIVDAIDGKDSNDGEPAEDNSNSATT